MKSTNCMNVCINRWGVLLVLLLAAPGLTLADSSGKQARHWQKYVIAKEELIQAWQVNADDDVYRDAIYRVGKYQTYLLAAHVRPDDERLLGRLAEGKGFVLRSSYDYPVFAYRVFKYELWRLTGFDPNPGNLFHKQTFSIYKRDMPLGINAFTSTDNLTGGL